MRAFDRDLIRGGHYGQRSREPRSKAEHMAAPTNTALVKKVLANSEPSTHGPYATFTHVRLESGMRGRADMLWLACHPFSYCRTTWRKFSTAQRLVARL
jgi:hypothetical protein